MNRSDLFPADADRGEAFRLLSGCFLLPDNGLGSRLKALEAHLERVCRGAAPHVARMSAHLENGGDLGALQVEFSRLFVGPFGTPAPPYGSVYLDGDKSFMGESALDVRQRYQEEGLGLSTRFHETPDHITAELEFVYFLTVKALEAAAQGDPDASGRYLEKRKRFLADHLDAWTPEFERLTTTNARVDFFTDLVRATRALIRTDLAALSDSPPTPCGGQGQESPRRPS